MRWQTEIYSGLKMDKIGFVEFWAIKRSTRGGCRQSSKVTVNNVGQ
jgi:hypothetical protein